MPALSIGIYPISLQLCAVYSTSGLTRSNHEHESHTDMIFSFSLALVFLFFSGVPLLTDCRTDHKRPKLTMRGVINFLNLYMNIPFAKRGTVTADIYYYIMNETVVTQHHHMLQGEGRISRNQTRSLCNSRCRG